MTRIILAAREAGLAAAWHRWCGDLDFVTVHHGSILDVRANAIVSPANSFGFMDGGIDALYSQSFGWHVQERLRQAIADRHHGELIVGAAEIVETDAPLIGYVIAAPTMRVPMALEARTISPYLATRAALLLVQRGVFHSGAFAGEPIADHVRSLAFPGMGTGIGAVSFDLCARQCRAAIDEVLVRGARLPETWADAKARHRLLHDFETEGR